MPAQQFGFMLWLTEHLLPPSGLLNPFNSVTGVSDILPKYQYFSKASAFHLNENIMKSQTGNAEKFS